MTRQEIMNYIAEEFRIEPDEEGEFDIDSYDWQSGCYHNREWLSLAKVVYMIESLLEDFDLM